MLSIKLNDTDLRAQLGPCGQRWLKVSFPISAVQPGYNTIDLEGDGTLEARFFADDVYNYRRSFYDPGTGRWRNDRLDVTTYRRAPALHMGGHEFKIRLEIVTAQPPSADTLLL